MEPHVTHYSIMPIAPVEEQTSYFEAGPITIGVEYRLLNDAIGARHLDANAPDMQGVETIDDRGVSLHVFNKRGLPSHMRYCGAGCRMHRKKLTCWRVMG